MTIPPTITPPLPPPPATYQPTPDDRTMCLLIHLSLLFFWPLALILWIMKKDQSPFIDHHGKQALSMLIASLVASLICVVLIFVCIGIILLPLLIVAQIVLTIQAALAANRGEWYQYPYIGNIIK